MFCGLENAKKKQTVSDFLWLYPPLHQSCKEYCPLAPLRNDLHCCIAPGSECHWLGSEPCPSKPWWQAMGSCLDSVNRFERDWIKFYCSCNASVLFEAPKVGSTFWLKALLEFWHEDRISEWSCILLSAMRQNNTMHVSTQKGYFSSHGKCWCLLSIFN